MARAFGYSWFLHASMALMVALLWADAGSVEASIFFTEEPLRDVEQLPAPADTSSSSSSSTGDQDQQPADEDGRHGDTDPWYANFLGQPQPSSRGMGSETSASTGGACATGTLGINPTARVPVTDTELTSLVAGEHSFTLPIPPDNELLRPPQVL